MGREPAELVDVHTDAERPARAFATGSISLRLYPHALPPTAKLDELQRQAALASAAGFDGVMLSERHGGAWGQIPNPLQAAGWLLEAMPDGWAAPCPLLLPFRTPGIVAEELAWLDARFPGRVGAGFGAGGNEPDFALMGVPFADRARVFGHHLCTLVDILRGDETVADPAIARARITPIPLLSAAMSTTAARRAATLGIGIIGSSLLSTDQTMRVVGAYRGAGGCGPHVVIVRVWLGDPPLELMQRQFAEYGRPNATEGLVTGDAVEVAGRVAEVAVATRATALNIRVHVAGLAAERAREQIRRIGHEVLPLVRRHWTPAHEVRP